MSNYKNPFSKGGKFYNPRITDASRVTDASKVIDASKVTKPRIRPRWQEVELTKTNDNDARYIITVYSPYISHKIKWALEKYSIHQKSERIKKLLAHIFTYANFTPEQKYLVRKGLNQGEYSHIQLPEDLSVAKIEPNIGSNKLGIIFYLVIGTPKPNIEEPKKINSPYIIERKEYATASRLFLDRKINFIENIKNEITDHDYLISAVALIPFSIALFSSRLLKWVVLTGITVEGKLGLGYGIAGKFSFGLAADPQNNLAFVGSAAGFISCIASIAGENNPEQGVNWYAGVDLGISADINFTNLKHIRELSGEIYEGDIDFKPIKWLVPDITIQHTNLEFKGIELSLGVSILGGFGKFTSKTIVLGFSILDIAIFANQTRKFVERIKYLISNQYLFFPFIDIIETNYSDKYVLQLYIFNKNENSENIIEQIQNGTLNIEPIKQENYVLIEFIKEYDNNNNVYFYKTLKSRENFT